MFLIKTAKIRSYEKGLYFRDREFQGLLDTGRHWFVDPLFKVKVDVVSQRTPWIEHEDLDVIVKSGALEGHAIVVDLKDYQRALVRVEGRFEKVLGPGLYALLTKVRDVQVDIIDARKVRFEHEDINLIAKSKDAENDLNISTVEPGYAGVYFKDGAYVETLGPGQYMFWKNMGKVKFYHVGMRETVLDVSGQEIMTSDKVTLRMNSVVTYRVVDALKSVSVVDDSKQAVYREVQLALRAVVGTFDLDTLMSDKQKVAEDLESTVKDRAAEFGIDVLSIGIRDVILPGDMKDMMNKVIEAQKAADANLIMRREETAAMRSQANTAKLLDSNPTLMRLHELDVLEKIAANSKLNVVLGEKGLADRIVNLL
ncbi:Putative stomatin/prohibitin-family membrane protease subunit PA4582 [Olavius sp. associated proteobacterium Delta 1]|nr:Putative stomatin/prohibitin-family membrane protease subunit PA4582 [Olavius sp. associated proteobacterium Delta 1]